MLPGRIPRIAALAHKFAGPLGDIGVRPMPAAAQQAVIQKHYVSTWSRRCNSSLTA